MSAKKTQSYDESKIKTLSSLEHIRLRSGMYIGRLGDGSNPDDGIYVLLKEVIDNSIDEFIMGYGKRILVDIKDNLVKVRDFGRGIPLGKVVECVSVINTGAKYNDDVFQFSVGLNGVGTKAVNALSSHFRVVAFRDGKYKEAVFSKGKLFFQKGRGQVQRKETVLILNLPLTAKFSESIFITLNTWNSVSGTMHILTGDLLLSLVIILFVSEKGLLDLLYSEVGDETFYDIIHHSGDKLEFAFTHTRNYGETFFSFVNGQFTSDGGTHLSAFREGILKGVNDFFKKSYTGQDVREGIAGTISIKLKDPVFESQTKNKLGNTEVRSWIVNEVKSAVVDFLHKNQPLSKKLEDKIINNEKTQKRA